MKPLDAKLPSFHAHRSIESLDNKHGCSAVQKVSVRYIESAGRSGVHAEIFDLGQVVQVTGLENMRCCCQSARAQPSFFDGQSRIMGEPRFALHSGERKP